ncbi:MAG TPA: TatD family hydrolase [Kiritimatiellia bacterium]|nr:TatD family hydrolase [Kiritimatiellia bacterium]
MEWIDSHAHFDRFAAEGVVEEVLERAAGAGVVTSVAIGGSDEANELALELARSHPGRIYATAGYDRDRAEGVPAMEAVEGLLAEKLVVGVGETGLDYHYTPETAEVQKQLFEKHLELAVMHVKPVVVHTREADGDTLDLLRMYVREWRGDAGRPGVIHCFTGDRAFAGKLLDLGFLLSFSGIVTFRNAEELREVAKATPLDRLLIETDAPYLAPVPHRGKTNEPGYVVHVAETLASVRGDALQRLSEQTTTNARFLFGLAQG